MYLFDKISMQVNELIQKHEFISNSDQSEIEDIKNSVIEQSTDVTGWLSTHFYHKTYNGEYVHVLLLYVFKPKPNTISYRIFIGKNSTSWVGKNYNKIFTETIYSGVNMVDALEHTLLTALNVIAPEPRTVEDNSKDHSIFGIVKSFLNIVKR